jgi:PKD domain
MSMLTALCRAGRCSRTLVFERTPQLIALLAVGITASWALPSASLAAGGGTGTIPLGSVLANVYANSGTYTQTVTGTQLESCPTSFTGDSLPINAPGEGFITNPETGALPDNWALATVIECGLGIPVDGGMRVVVVNSGNGSGPAGAEAALTGSQLTNPRLDASGQGLLPLITAGFSSTSGTVPTEDWYYYRPSEGGTDYNDMDSFTALGNDFPIDVYPDASSLKVTPTVTISGSTVLFNATVTEDDGTVVPATDLAWTWNFADGSADSTASPPLKHIYKAGRYTVEVDVTLNSLGTKGVGTLPFQIAAAKTTTTQTQTTPPPITTTPTPNTGGSQSIGAPNGPTKSAGAGAQLPSGGKGSGHGTAPIRAVGGTGTGSGPGKGTSSKPGTIAVPLRSGKQKTAPQLSGGLHTAAGGTGSGGSGGNGDGTSLSARGHSDGLSSGTASGRGGHDPGAVAGGRHVHGATPNGASGGAGHGSQRLVGVLISDVAPISSTGAGSLESERAKGSALPERASTPLHLPQAALAGIGLILLVGIGLGREIRAGRRPRRRRRTKSI